MCTRNCTTVDFKQQTKSRVQGPGHSARAVAPFRSTTLGLDHPSSCHGITPARDGCGACMCACSKLDAKRSYVAGQSVVTLLSVYVNNDEDSIHRSMNRETGELVRMRQHHTFWGSTSVAAHCMQLRGVHPYMGRSRSDQIRIPLCNDRFCRSIKFHTFQTIQLCRVCEGDTRWA